VRGLRRRARALAAAAAETVAALAVAVCVEVGLRVTTLPRLCARLGIATDVPTTSTSARAADTPGPAVVAVLPVAARAAVAACDRVLRVWPFGDTCLRRCLVLGQRLRRLHPVLRIGVHMQRPGGRPGAHSWLEIGGSPLEAGVEQYAVLGGLR
jgi:hypothetical protein